MPHHCRARVPQGLGRLTSIERGETRLKKRSVFHEGLAVHVCTASAQLAGFHGGSACGLSSHSCNCSSLDTALDSSLLGVGLGGDHTLRGLELDSQAGLS